MLQELSQIPVLAEKQSSLPSIPDTISDAPPSIIQENSTSTPSNTKIVLPEKKYMFNAETQVSEIDFDILEYRIPYGITKVDHPSLKMQEELPVLLKGAMWKKYVPQATPEVFIPSLPKLESLKNIRHQRDGSVDLETEYTEDPRSNATSFVIKDTLVSPRNKDKELITKRLTSSMLELSKSSFDNFLAYLSHFVLMTRDLISQVKRDSKIALPDKTLFKDGKLSFRGNGISGLSLSLLDYGEKLQQVDISYNFIITLPKWFADPYESITIMDLSHNLLFHLPTEFSNFVKLKELNLSHNRFEYIPEAVLNLVSLTSLNMRYNHLLIVPYDIIRLKKTLTELDLSHNDLYDLPEEMKQLKKLKYLDLDYNKFLYYTTFVMINNPSFIPDESKKKRKIAQFFRLVGIEFDVDPEKLYKQVRQNLFDNRQAILYDLLIGERNYVNHLHVFYETIFMSFKTMIDTVPELKLNSDDLELMMPRELIDIYNFAKDFYMQLATRILQYSGDLSPILVYFMSKKKYFVELYTKYVFVYQRSLEVIDELEKKNPEFAKALVAKKKLRICGGNHLSNYLSLPLSRLARYHTRMTSILELETQDPMSEENQLLQQLVLDLNEIITIQNVEYETANNIYQIVELERQYSKTLRKTARRFVKGSKLIIAPNFDVDSVVKDVSKAKGGVNLLDFTKLTLANVKEMKLDDIPSIKNLISKNLSEIRIREGTIFLYLFSDMIMIAETGLNSLNTYSSITTYNLTPNSVCTSSIENEKLFTIELEGNKKFILKTENSDDKRAWVDAFTSNIDKIKEKKPEVEDDLFVHVEVLDKSKLDPKKDVTRKESVGKSVTDPPSPVEKKDLFGRKSPTSTQPDKVLDKTQSVKSMEVSKKDPLKSIESALKEKREPLHRRVESIGSIQSPKSVEPISPVDRRVETPVEKKDLTIKTPPEKVGDKKYNPIERLSTDKRPSTEKKRPDEKLSPLLLTSSETGYFQHVVIINAPPEKCMSVITDFEKYGEYLSQISSVKIVKHDNTLKMTDVEFKILYYTVSYTLRHYMVDDNTLTWTCVNSLIFSKNSGSWVLEPHEKGTKATYTIVVQFLINNNAITQLFLGKPLTERILAIKERIENVDKKESKKK